MKFRKSECYTRCSIGCINKKTCIWFNIVFFCPYAETNHHKIIVTILSIMEYITIFYIETILNTFHLPTIYSIRE
jgi:hypothetical protein